MRNLLGMFFAVAMFMFFGGNVSASELPPVPTTITNAPKAQFIGSMVTATPGKFTTTVTPLNPQFRDCAACTAWLDGATLTENVAKFTDAQVQTVWGTSGYLGYVGTCVNSLTGAVCSATPQ